jgi:hypothetical protein
MWKILSRLFMIFGVIIFAGAFLFLWGYFWGSMKADVAFNYILIFLLQVVLGGFLYFVGDLMLRIQGESKTVEHLFGKYMK